MVITKFSNQLQRFYLSRFSKFMSVTNINRLKSEIANALDLSAENDGQNNYVVPNQIEIFINNSIYIKNKKHFHKIRNRLLKFIDNYIHKQKYKLNGRGLILNFVSSSTVNTKTIKIRCSEGRSDSPGTVYIPKKRN